MKEYPNELTVVFFYNLFVSIMATMVGLVMEPDSSAWKLKPRIALASVVCSVRNRNIKLVRQITNFRRMHSHLLI